MAVGETYRYDSNEFNFSLEYGQKKMFISWERGLEKMKFPSKIATLQLS